MLQQKISKYYSYRLLNNSSNDLLSDSFWAGRFQNTVHGKRVTGIGCTAKPTFTLVALMRPMPRAGLYGIYYFIYNIAYFIYLLSTVNLKKYYFVVATVFLLWYDLEWFFRQILYNFSHQYSIKTLRIYVYIIMYIWDSESTVCCMVN